MKRRRTALAVISAALVLAVAPLAAGQPASTSPPAIKGYPGYNSVLTCDPGGWTGAQQLDYEWLYAGNNPNVFATGPKYRVEASRVGYDIACRVTATDSGGAQASATSPSVRTGPGRTTIVLKAKKVQHGKVKLTGKVGPRAAVEGAGVVAYRVESHTLFQLFGKTVLRPSGRFRIVAPDKPGKNKYKVNFNPAEPSLWQFAHATVKVRLKKH